VRWNRPSGWRWRLTPPVFPDPRFFPDFPQDTGNSRQFAFIPAFGSSENTGTASDLQKNPIAVEQGIFRTRTGKFAEFSSDADVKRNRDAVLCC
jgi:hypothetical protein